MVVHKDLLYDWAFGEHAAFEGYASPDGGGVVYDDVGPTGLQPLVDRSIEVCRRRAPGLDQRGVEIVVEQVQP